MEILYILFAAIGIFAECSKSIDTRNLIKKGGLFLIVIGALIQIYNIDNNLFQLGAMLYIVTDIFKSLKER